MPRGRRSTVAGLKKIIWAGAADRKKTGVPAPVEARETTIGPRVQGRGEESHLSHEKVEGCIEPSLKGGLKTQTETRSLHSKVCPRVRIGAD